MGSAELALFLHFSSESAAAVATSSSAIEAIANAAVRGQAALSAVLASEGHTMSAEARNALLLAPAAERDQGRHAGAGPDGAQAAYVSAAFQAFEAAGVSAEALVLAHAAAATAFDAAMAGAQSAGSARIEVTRSALLVSLHGRERVASAVQGAALGLKSAAITTIDLIEVRVRAAQSVGELEAALDEERASIEARVVGSVLASLPGLGGTVGAEVEAQLRSAIQSANLWADLEGAMDASATVEAIYAFRARVQASAEDVMASLPTEVQAGVSVEVLVQLMISLGAGAGIA
jgi:hypothetical protein